MIYIFFEYFFHSNLFLKLYYFLSTLPTATPNFSVWHSQPVCFIFYPIFIYLLYLRFIFVVVVVAVATFADIINWFGARHFPCGKLKCAFFFLLRLVLFYSFSYIFFLSGLDAIGGTTTPTGSRRLRWRTDSRWQLGENPRKFPGEKSLKR